MFDTKTVKRQELLIKEDSLDNPKNVVKETVPEAAAPKFIALELRIRVSNAAKAIKSLGGEVTDFDAGSATDSELQEELEALTE